MKYKTGDRVGKSNTTAFLEISQKHVLSDYIIGK